MTTRAVRRLGSLTEAVHAVAYFASRTAALGRTSADVATAVLGGFAPQTLARAIPSVWDLTTPELVVGARTEGARAALQGLLGGTDVDGLVALLEPLAARAATALPFPNAMGLRPV